MPSRSLKRCVLALACAVCLAAWADALSDIEQLYRKGQVTQALQLADERLASSPRDARLRFFKGVMLSELNRTAEAEQTFKSLSEDFPELSDPYNNLAVLYASQGELTLALQALQAALRNDPRNAMARENLGDVYLALAVQAWMQASAASSAANPGLQRKLRLARRIDSAATPLRAASAPG